MRWVDENGFQFDRLTVVFFSAGRHRLLRWSNRYGFRVASFTGLSGSGMYHSGIGGGGFMLVRGSNGSYEFIDFRETAPAAAFQDMYKDNVNASIYGGLARSVAHHMTPAALTGV